MVTGGGTSFERNIKVAAIHQGDLASGEKVTPTDEAHLTGLMATGQLELQFNDGTTWQSVTTQGFHEGIVTDGANVRFNNADASANATIVLRGR